jgi:hypothetical protein
MSTILAYLTAPALEFAPHDMIRMKKRKPMRHDLLELLQFDQNFGIRMVLDPAAFGVVHQLITFKNFRGIFFFKKINVRCFKMSDVRCIF